MLSESVRRNLQAALESRDRASHLRDEARRGQELSTEAIAGIKRIEDSSGAVARIVATIDEIAFQTNLLALNASVEAARAGPAGRGFSGAAAEVRTLAGRCAAASGDIDMLITENRSTVMVSAAQAHSTARVLESFDSEMRQLDETVRDVTAASEEQAGGVESLRAAIHRIDTVAQENAGQVRATDDMVRRLTRSADALGAAVVAFTTAGDIERGVSAPLRATG
jgi:methyl-accepting chemotaxis protein